MARFCTVAPPQILEVMQENGLFDLYHLVLAHDIVKHPKRYRDIFAKLDKPNKFVILDNSVIETGNAVDLVMIAEAADIVNPTCVVLPDSLLNAQYTHTLSMIALESSGWQKLAKKYELLMLPQGSTLREWAWCAERFADHPLVSYWGVPRNLVAPLGTRHQAIKLAKALNKRRPIHMFGFSDDLIDDIICANMPEVYSIDSAVPLRHPGILSFTSEVGKRGDWWEKGRFQKVTHQNVQWIRQVMQYR